MLWSTEKNAAQLGGVADAGEIATKTVAAANPIEATSVKTFLNMDPNQRGEKCPHLELFTRYETG